MASDNSLSLVQQEPFGEIEIEINHAENSKQSTKGSIIIKDKQGNEYEFSWPELSGGQQKKVIKDLINNEIIYVR